MSCTTPGSNSIVVMPAVEPTTNTVTMPAFSADAVRSRETSVVRSWASPWLEVETSCVDVAIIETLYGSRTLAGSTDRQLDRSDHLFGAERNDRIDPGGAAGGQERGDERHRDEGQRHGRQRERVERGDLEQQAGEIACARHAGGEAQRDSDRREPRAL